MLKKKCLSNIKLLIFEAISKLYLMLKKHTEKSICVCDDKDKLLHLYALF